MNVSEVGKNIQGIFERRKKAIYALCLFYAAKALNLFRVGQHEELYWENQTGQAYARVFAGAKMEDAAVSFFIAHGVQYGVYLELANDRAHEALKPIIDELYDEFVNALMELQQG